MPLQWCLISVAASWCVQTKSILKDVRAKTCNIDFFIKLLLQLGFELLLSEMKKNWGVTDFVSEMRYLKGHLNFEKSVFLTQRYAIWLQCPYVSKYCKWISRTEFSMPIFIFVHDIAWRCDMNCVRSKDAHKQLARTSLRLPSFLENGTWNLACLFHRLVKSVSGVSCALCEKDGYKRTKVRSLLQTYS